MIFQGNLEEAKVDHSEHDRVGACGGGRHDVSGPVDKIFLTGPRVQEKPATIYQDNMSSIQLENNGRASSSKRTRLVKIWYYFVTDKIRDKEAIVAYCPTKEMIADILTKPLQGALFTKLRALLLNLKDELPAIRPKAALGRGAARTQTCTVKKPSGHKGPAKRAKKVANKRSIKKVSWAEVVRHGSK